MLYKGFSFITLLGRILCCIREKITINTQLFTHSWYVQTASDGACPYLQFISRYKQLCKAVRPFKEQKSFLFKTIQVLSG